MVEATIRELRWIARTHAADHVAILSGEDYPVRPLLTWEREVEDLDALIWADPVTPDDVHRYTHRWYKIPWSNNWSEHGRGRLINKALVQVSKRIGLGYQMLPAGRGGLLGVPFPSKDLTIYKGWQWMMLSTKSIEVIAGPEGQKLVARFRHSLIPDEAFIHTVVLNEPSLITRRGLLSFTSWTGATGEAHPEMINQRHLEAIRLSRAPFARKVDEGPILEILDQQNA